MDVWVRNNEVLRITSRANLDVNEYWIPDAARLVYETYNTNRASGPQLEGRPASWKAATDRAAELVKEAGSDILFVGSPYATVEDNYLLGQLAEAVGADAPVYLDRRVAGSGDGWLISDDPAPNTAGCERLGFRSVETGLFESLVRSAKLVYILQDDVVAAGLTDADALADTPVLLHPTHTTNETLPVADVVLPIAMSVETIGTYVNEDGRAQLLRPAKTVRSMNRSLMMALGTGQGRTDVHGTPFDKWHDEDNKVDCLPGWAVLPDVASAMDYDLSVASPKALMDKIAQLPAFAGATHAAMGELGVSLEDAAQPA